MSKKLVYSILGFSVLGLVALVYGWLAQPIVYVSEGLPQTADEVEEPTTHPSVIPLAPIFFTGDIMMGRHVERLLAAGEPLLNDLVPLFATATAVVINFESAVATPHVPTQSGEMRFSTRIDLLPKLKDWGVTHASLANNHALDYGRAGYEGAITALADIGVTAFGHPVIVSTSSITYVSYGKKRVALIGIHTLFSPIDETDLETVMQVANQSSDIQIPYIHWGDEYELTHSTAQRDLATRLVNLGADAIVGHHPHVTQDIDLIDGVPVFYSLGNTLFDQYFSADVQAGLILGLSLSNNQMSFSLYPHVQRVKSTPNLMQNEQKVAFLEALASRSNSVLTEQILAGQITMPLAQNP